MPIGSTSSKKAPPPAELSDDRLFNKPVYTNQQPKETPRPANNFIWLLVVGGIAVITLIVVIYWLS